MLCAAAAGPKEENSKNFSAVIFFLVSEREEKIEEVVSEHHISCLSYLDDTKCLQLNHLSEQPAVFMVGCKCVRPTLHNQLHIKRHIIEHLNR